MSKDPAFLFYPDNWLGGTMHMQRITRACYLDLMLLQFHVGAFSLEQMQECLGPDVDKWELIKDKFECENSRYYNERLRIEINKRSGYCESRKAGAYAMHMQCTPKIKIKIKSDLDKEGMQGGKPLWVPFDDFWAAYPRKEGKGAAIKAWSKIKEPNSSLNIILEALIWQKKSEQWTKDNGQFIPHPATYLNNQRWLDEPKGNQSAFPSLAEQQRITAERDAAAKKARQA
jgi:hypothetical protein